MFYVCDGRRHLLRPGKYGGPKRWRGRRAGREGPAPLHARANGRAAGPVEGAAPRRTTRRALTGPWRRADARRSPAVPRGLSGPRPARLRSARPPRTRSVSPKPFPERAAHSPAAAAPRSRWPRPSPLRGGTWVARRALVCGFGGRWNLSPALPTRSSPDRPRTGVRGRKSHSISAAFTRCEFCFLSRGPYADRLGWFTQLRIFANKLIKIA